MQLRSNGWTIVFFEETEEDDPSEVGDPKLVVGPFTHREDAVAAGRELWDEHGEYDIVESGVPA